VTADQPDTAACREYDLGDILSVTTDRLVSPRHVDGLYDLLGFMVGEPVWTHQLPRASRECKPDLLKQHPQLRQVVVPEWEFGPEDDAKAIVYAWLDEQKAIYGDTLPVTPLGPEDHTRIDPISELKMMRPDMPIIVVEAPDGT
jgi:hypothetical protein